MVLLGIDTLMAENHSWEAMSGSRRHRHSSSGLLLHLLGAGVGVAASRPQISEIVRTLQGMTYSTWHTGMKTSGCH